VVFVVFVVGRVFAVWTSDWYETVMLDEMGNEPFAEQKVTYMLEHAGEIVVIRNVPARVNLETGERLFAPETVEQIQAILRSGRAPVEVVQAPVFEFNPERR
jgi:hypothetical protein